MFSNKFGLLEQLKEKEKKVVISATIKPKEKKPKADKPKEKKAPTPAATTKKADAAAVAPAAALPNGVVLKKKKVEEDPTAPRGLKNAILHNQKEAEKLAEAKRAKEAELAAKKAEAEEKAKAEAEAKAEVAAAAEAEGEKPAEEGTEAANGEKKEEEKKEKVPPKEVKSLDEIIAEKALNKFVIAKQERVADTKIAKDLVLMSNDLGSDRIVVQSAPKQKTAAQKKAEKAKAVQQPAAVAKKEQKKVVIDLKELFVENQGGRGRGRGRGDGERPPRREGGGRVRDGDRPRGRGGYRGRGTRHEDPQTKLQMAPVLPGLEHIAAEAAAAAQEDAAEA